MSTKQYISVVFIVVFSILGAFYSGFFLKDNIDLSTNNGQLDSQQLFRPNFIDEIIVVTEDEPRKVLILSAIRTFVDKETTNYTVKAFFYNGDIWSKEIREGKSQSLEDIPNTEVVNDWKILNDPSYMLKQSVSGEAHIDNQIIKFEAPIIENEIGIRSHYKYTKFMSEARGTLEINKKTQNAKIVYSRIYSFNPPESLIFTSDPAGIETEWLAFWDQEGNFYSIDETSVDNKKTLETYKAHSLGVYKDKNEGIQKSFNLNLEKSGPQSYSVKINDKINNTISIEKLNSVNKSINGKDIWVTGIVNGSVKVTNGKTIIGFGVYEQISQ